ncbi:MAG: YceI family protein [Cytophagales bacterium]|nr:YceI family protein [Cytophagales bacterium]
MKKQNILLALAALLVFANAAWAGNGPQAPTTLKADVEKSTLTWNGKKVTGEHTGTIKLSNGSLQVNGAKLVGGSFDIDMNSIVCTDITDAEYNTKFIGHMKSEDFFNTAKFPTATFKITKVKAKGGQNYDVTGDLTVKGITKPVTFPVVLKTDGTPSTTISRLISNSWQRNKS